MAKYATLNGLFTGIADALRRKTGNDGSIVADDFPSVIDSLSMGGITPTGTKTITENGTHDVTNYATAQVNVPVPEQNFHVFPITLSSAYTGAAAEHTLLSGNEFVKAHYADEGFFIMWIPLGLTEKAPSGTAMWAYHGNRKMAIANSSPYGVFARSTGESSNVVWMPEPGNLSVNNWNVSFKANSSGNVIMYRSASYTIPAGEYRLVLGLVE